MPKFAAVILTLMSGPLLLACGDSFDEKFGGGTWESEHFRYRYQAGDPRACSEVLGPLEAYARLIASALGVDESALGVTNYYKYPTQASFPAVEQCGGPAMGCANSTEILGAFPLMGHELVHNVMAKKTSMAVSVLLMEGLANALTCDPGTIISVSQWDFRTFNTAAPTVEDVVSAGRLVMAMLQHLELTDVMDMLASIDKSVSLEDTRLRVLSRWGLDLDSLLNEISGTGLGACAPLYACSGPPLAEAETTLRVSCKGFDPATLPADAGPIGLRVSGKPLLLIPCDYRQALSPIARLAPYRTVGDWEYWLESPAAKHAVWVDGVERLDYDTEAKVSLRRTPSLFAKECSPTGYESVALGKQVAIVVTGSEGVIHFPLSFGQAVPLRLHWQDGNGYDGFGGPSSTVKVDWCGGCQAGVATDCANASSILAGAQTLQTTGQGVLVLRTTSPLPRAAVLEVTPLYP